MVLFLLKYRELRGAGVGANVKHAAIITAEEEDQFWNMKILVTTAP